MAFFQSLGIVALLIVMSNNRARYGIMASPPSCIISPETLSGLFKRIADNLFLMILVLMAKDSPELARCICGMLCSQLNTKEEYKLRKLAFSFESIMSCSLPSLIAGIFSLLPLHLFTYL
jgi:hypothetical protein